MLRNRNYHERMDILKQLTADIDAFLARHGMLPTQFGVLALNDGGLMTKLRGGTDIRASRIDRIYKFMSDYEKKSQKIQSEQALELHSVI